MPSVEDDIRKFFHDLDRDSLAMTHRLITAEKIKQPTIEFLDMIARHPQYVADHERPGVLVVPKDLKFTHAKGIRTVETALLSADIVEYDSGYESPAYVSVNYAALAQLFPELADKPEHSRTLTIEFEQRRCPSTLVNLRDDATLRTYMENVENVLVYFMAKNGMDGRKLYRTADNVAVMPREAGEEQNAYLKSVYHKAVTYESFATHGPQDEISFGIITRRMLPHFCNLIELFYRHDEATQRATMFAFPVLDIGKMRFLNNGADHGAQYQRVTQVHGKDIVKQETVTNGEWLRHEMCEMLAGPMREMEIIPKDFLGRFFNLVDDIRTLVTEAGPFRPQQLSAVHQAFIPRLH